MFPVAENIYSQLQFDKKDKKSIVGLTTEHCISTTTRMASNLGYETYLIADATAAFDKIGINGEKYPAQLVHDIALANLNDEFATVVNTEEFLEKMI